MYSYCGGGLGVGIFHHFISQFLRVFLTISRQVFKKAHSPFAFHQVTAVHQTVRLPDMVDDLSTCPINR